MMTTATTGGERFVADKPPIKPSNTTFATYSAALSNVERPPPPLPQEVHRDVAKQRYLVSSPKSLPSNHDSPEYRMFGVSLLQSESPMPCFQQLGSSRTSSIKLWSLRGRWLLVKRVEHGLLGFAHIHHHSRLRGHTINADIGQEWRHQLRSSIQPVLLSAVYMLVSTLSSIIGLPPTLRAQLLILLPKILFALSAAIMDYSTWRLAGRVYGKGSVEARAAVRSVHRRNIIQVLQSSRLICDSLVQLALTIFSPWQWFCSTRPFSNSFEATLTATALYYWPFEWMKPRVNAKARAHNKSKYETKCVLECLI